MTRRVICVGFWICICVIHIRGSGQFSGLSLSVGRKAHLDSSWVTPFAPLRLSFPLYLQSAICKLKINSTSRGDPLVRESPWPSFYIQKTPQKYHNIPYPLRIPLQLVVLRRKRTGTRSSHASMETRAQDLEKGYEFWTEIRNRSTEFRTKAFNFLRTC